MKQRLDRLPARRAPLPVLRNKHGQVQLRHTAWAAAIAGKFARCKRPGMNPESLIFLELMRRLVLLRALKPQLYFTNQNLSRVSTFLRGVSLAPQVLVKPGSAVPLLNRPDARSQSGKLLFEQAAGPRTRTVIASTQAEESGRLVLPTPAFSFESGQPLWPRRTFLRKESAPAAMTELLSNSSAVAARIARQLQRVEIMPAMARPVSEVTPAAIPEAQRLVATVETRARKERKLEPAEDPAPLRQKTRPAPEINVAQITEQVLNQLDHRLVAMRERMGRI